MSVRRKQLQLPVILLVAAVGVISSAIWTDTHYERQAADTLETRRLLLATDVALHDLAALEWEAIARGGSGRVAAHVADVGRDLDARAVELGAEDPMLEPFADAVSRYVALVDHEIELIGQGRLAEMETVRQEIEEVFEEIEEIEDTTFVVLMDRAARSSALARVVSRISLVVVTAVAAFAVFRLQRARQIGKSIAEKDRFLATVSHELRTPLTALVGITAVLRDGIEDCRPEVVAEFLDDLAGEATEMSMLIEDLLVMARTEIGSVSVRQDVLDMRGCVLHALKTISLEEPERVELKSGEVVAVADPLRVRQIIRNLVTNAVRYGGPRIRIECAEGEGVASVSVIDDGAGVPLSERRRIFEPYERGRRDQDVTGSVGLGLAVSRDLARRMGGDLRYEYSGGESVFKLTLPTADRVPAAAGRT